MPPARSSRRKCEAAKGNGFEPVEFVVARDAIAVIVNPENPVQQLTLQQISDIYSGKINNWKELGGEDRPIVRLSRETNSGTHVYFLETVVRLGSKTDKSLFSPDTLLLPSSEGIISEVRDNPNAIGYDGLGYVTARGKDGRRCAAMQAALTFCLRLRRSTTRRIPSRATCTCTPVTKPTGAIKDYLDWILVPKAQQIVTELGFRARYQAAP